MAPIILENLLPYDFRYIIQDRANRQQLGGSLKVGEKNNLHTVDPSHLLALNISLQEIGLKQKEYVVITSTDLEYRDEHLILADTTGNEVSLRIRYEYCNIDP